MRSPTRSTPPHLNAASRRGPDPLANAPQARMPDARAPGTQPRRGSGGAHGRSQFGKSGWRPNEAGHGRDAASGAATVHWMHRMPFGPRLVEEHNIHAGYRFRLWAPAEKAVEVVLHQPDGECSYHPCAKSDGWHSCKIPTARPGDRYSFRLDGQLEVPDPASRYNPDGVHGPSVLVDPTTFAWDAGWSGRPWEAAVIYELHVGTFTAEGTYAAAEARLDELAALGITAIELMPLAEFSGARGWGYDGVLPYAPKAAYGTPDALKHFIQAAHRRGLMVMLDVVYNHFGPDGNYLHVYAPQFFSQHYETPWGAAIDFESPYSAHVREFFIHNALYWLEEYRFDGLRLDAVHGIFDRSNPHILEELSSRARMRLADRRIHLVVENVDNTASRLGRPGLGGHYEAQWNDDFHHAAHVLLTGEHDGYYADFAERPVQLLVRCLAEGFAFQGEHSAFHDAPRGEPSSALPATAFVNFLQNHDQIGNRALGERLTTLTDSRRLRALVAIQLLAPSPPLIFMGEEAGATTPFLFFCDYPGELAKAVREGRQREFAAFMQFHGEDGAQLPDPCGEESFARSKLDWGARGDPPAREWLALYRELLAQRHAVVVPRVAGVVPGRSTWHLFGERTFEVRWVGVDGGALVMRANLDDLTSPLLPALEAAPFAAVGSDSGPDRLGPWAVQCYLLPGAGQG
ncbi:putative malto-oligosyltrehalose trehalohydrolase [Azoarcus olearius]|uniref:malto-oligosyltrehalose trehalohydrolase n=1 Tax=Azoarcus sp. (strain BH72) TaxID=418699 RepID=UPI000806082C|nr:malto-oligosyltrehalose trehalohydrolase [Azoarcus olearius]ANQ84985.1 putative malto-oligosyltrehalose trehalohydrolase [Azoarcus olearius]